MKFYVGLHIPAKTKHFDRFMVSVNVIKDRQSRLRGNGEWMLDSGAFSRITRGLDHLPIHRYAAIIQRHSEGRIRAPGFARLICAVSQDYMCEPFVLEKTGLSIAEHQHLTVERYNNLVSFLESIECSTYIMPVLQGYSASDYVNHIHQYSIKRGAWVGVGSVCKRNRDNPEEVLNILSAIKRERPDVKLHGFGLKVTVLSNQLARDMLYSADSMAWSLAARYDPDGDANSWHEAYRFARRIESLTTE